MAFGGAAHYAALVLSWRRQVEFVERYIRHARRAAWGDELGIKGLGNLGNFGAGSGSSEAAASSSAAPEDGPVVMNRRQKRMMDKESKKEKKAKNKLGDEDVGGPAAGTVTPAGDRKRVVAENGKVLIVDSVGNVFLEEQNEDGVTEEYLLDTSEIRRPTIRDTMVFRLPVWAYGKLVGRFIGPKAEKVEENAEVQEVADVDSDESLENIPTPPSSDGEKKKKKNAKARRGRK